MLLEEGEHQYYRAYLHDQTMIEEPEMCAYSDLFQFADRLDYFLMTIGFLFSIGNGVSIIFYARPLGDLADAFASSSVEKIIEGTLNSVYGFLINSVIVFGNSWVMSAAWTITAERQMIRGRIKYFESLLEQQTAWHDRKNPGKICSSMYQDIHKVHKALVNNVTSVLTKTSIGVSGLIMALVRGWQMAIVMLAFLPFMAGAAYASAYFQKKFEKLTGKMKTEIDSEIIQIFEEIKTVKLLGGESYEVQRFNRKTEQISKLTLQEQIKSKIAFAIFFFSILMNYALGFWYGAKLVSEKTYNPNTSVIYRASDVIVIFFALYVSNLNLSGLPESLTSFNLSRLAMSRISKMIRRKSRIEEGREEIPAEIQQIIFEDVEFEYKRPLFKNFHLKIQRGMTALIGSSGSGKTTIINLLLRFYDTLGGSIFFRTNERLFNLRDATFASLRGRIGYVGQEPVLIGKTIREALNAENTTEDELWRVLTSVNANEFVSLIGLDHEFSQLSGGQKQRIAIARALLRQPEILILDEGTSALDRKTEEEVLSSIQKVGIPFIIMVAHRTETLLNADRIILLKNGQILTEGTYNDLALSGILEPLLVKLSSPEKIDADSKQPNADQQAMHESLVELGERSKPVKSNDEVSVEDPKKFKWAYFLQLLKMNKQYCYFYVLGFIGAIFVGSIFPVFSYLLSHMFGTLSLIQAQNYSSIDSAQGQVRNLALALFSISVSSLLMVGFKGGCFAYLSEKLGVELKKRAFKGCIEKKMAEVEKEQKETYIQLINTNCESLKKLGGLHLGDIIENVTTILVGLGIAFGFCWQITCVALGIMPLILIAGKIQMDFNNGLTSQSDETHKKCHELVIMAVLNHKTIKSLTLGPLLSRLYQESLKQALKLSIRNGNIAGIMFGIAQSLISCMLAIIFYIGALLIQKNVTNMLDIYTAIYAVMFSGVQAGGNMLFLGQLSEAVVGAINYFTIIKEERGEEIGELKEGVVGDRSSSREWLQVANSDGIVFDNVTFQYASRESPVLQGFSLRIPAGHKIALVGQSGSGKSSIANLLLSLYEPTAGDIFINGHNLKLIPRSKLFAHTSVVTQEPVLFNRSIYENIAYNTPCTYEDVCFAAEKANALTFIKEGNFGLQSQDLLQLPEVTEEGFRKKAGPKGSYLSGGQKQRIAIARAIVRKPDILILDEATSALDNQNEELIRHTLASLKGTTQITIAHRLSTIVDADMIHVINQGKIVEQGTYQQLLEKKAYFFQLVNANSLHPNLTASTHSQLTAHSFIPARSENTDKDKK